MHALDNEAHKDTRKKLMKRNCGYRPADIETADTSENISHTANYIVDCGMANILPDSSIRQSRL